MGLLDRKKRFWPVLMVLTLFPAGCMTVGPDYVRPPTAVSPSWLDTQDERVKTDSAQYRAWWQAFEDPILNNIIDRAYRDNLSLKQAGVRVLEARAQLGIAVGNLYPQNQQINGSVNYYRNSQKSALAAMSQLSQQKTATKPGDDPNNPPDPNDNQDNKKKTSPSTPAMGAGYWQDQLNLNLNWEIDFWGKFRRAIQSADASLLAAVADYDSALVSLTADAANSYIQVRIFEKRLDIARQNVGLQTESFQIAEARFAGGVTSERDVEQARTVLFNTQATIPTLEGQLRQAKNALSVLLGMPPNDLETILGGASDIPAPPPQVAVGIPADLLRRRPDVRSAELQAMAQSAQIGIAKADLLPSFSLVGNLGLLSTDIGKFKLSDIASAKAFTATVGPSFQWNIFNYGRITNNVRVQDARFQELLLAYQNTVLRAQQEVEDSLAGFLKAQENAKFLALSAGAAKRSTDLASIQYREGTTDFTTVLTAQQALLTAQDSLAASVGNIATGLVGVYRAVGGGWQIRVGEDLISPEIRTVMEKRTNWGKLLSPNVYMPCSGEPQGNVMLPDW